jgi:hypothetical protein
MNPEIMQFDIIQSKLLQQLKKKQRKLILIYEITILNIIINLYYDCKHLIRRLFQLLSVSAWYNHIS